MPMVDAHGYAMQDQFYAYDISFASITSAQTLNGSVTVQADSNFLWQQTTFFAYKDGVTTAASDTILRPFTLQITDSGTGRIFFSQAIAMDCIAGTAKFPFVLYEPYLWKAVSVIQVTITNLDTATWDNLHLAFIGKKTYGSAPVG